MTRAIIYCRMSKNDRESDSLERQEATCQKYANEKGYEVVAVLKEKPGTSGAKFDAPELNQAIKAAKQKLYDVLIVRDLARFGRDRLKFELRELELSSYGVTVEYVWQEFDDTPTGKLHKSIMVDFEEFKRASIAQHLTQGRRDKVEQYGSFLVHGKPPLGYNVIKEGKIFKPVIDEFEAKIVEMIFNFYVVEGYSLTRIAKYLNENRVPCYSQLRANSNFGDKNSKWYQSTVRVILKNPIYKGEWSYGKEGIKETIKIVNNEIVTVYERKQNDDDYLLTLEVPAIVSEELWQAAQERLSKNQNLRGRKPKYEYLVSRFITCECGAKMFGSRRRGTGRKRMYFYYSCPKHAAKNNAICPQRNVRADRIDALAWGWFEELAKDKDKLKKRIDAYLEDKDKELRPILEEVNRLDEIISRRRKEYHKLVDLYLSSSDFGQQELLGRKVTLEKQLQEDEAKRNELQEQFKGLDERLALLKGYLELIKGDEERFNTNHIVIVYGEEEEDEKHIFELEDEVVIENQSFSKDMFLKDSPKTFDEKREYVKKFNLQVKLLGDDKILVSCDFAQGVLSLLNNDMYVPVKNMQHLIFSDILDFRPLLTKQQVEIVS